ncbi:glycosyltransferase [Mucilaginibacter arboris]|uniref:Glycosyltransferase family 1 protein n=1 Tax=Mucilaginibacter arboris TaxID=2682090 RepID=A0A7K1SSP6_9SPHI|nr:glycosyltransferase family 1 protein [Mucilaginibacter arboris]MVN20338.1 glycosyltransferase family 1 protein [Mucilaginibacter arboris]
MDQRYKIFTWPFNQQYLFELAQGDFDIYIPEGQNSSFQQQFSSQKNVIETNEAAIKDLSLDCILFQDEYSYKTAQYEVLSDQQRQLPKIYLEHHPPKQHPTNAKHLVEDQDVQLVHVNHYNALMWDNNQLQVTVIENGVTTNTVNFTGEKASGVVVLEEFPADGRVTGRDIFMQVKEALLLEVVQIGKEDVTYQNLPEKLSQYRFLFCPDRYASPGFAVYLAMMTGMPVVGLATTDLPALISSEVSGFADSDLNYLICKMKVLLDNQQLAIQMGLEARKTALQRFNQNRFLKDWKQMLENTIASKPLLIKI